QFPMSAPSQADPPYLQLSMSLLQQANLQHNPYDQSPDIRPQPSDPPISREQLSSNPIHSETFAAYQQQPPPTFYGGTNEWVDAGLPMPQTGFAGSEIPWEGAYEDDGENVGDPLAYS